MEAKSKRDEVIEIVNKLFIYTDDRQWIKLLSEVFKEKVFFDMSSLGGEKGEMQATAICDAWREGFQQIDAVHHQAGNYLVKFKEEETQAEVFCCAIAIHYKEDATKGQTREFVGSYDLRLVLTDYGWRIDIFRYNLKFITGNKALA
jgi:phage gp36-like protein